MNNAQARILIANARALQNLQYRDNPEFTSNAMRLVTEIKVIFDQLRDSQPGLTKALTVFCQNLELVIASLPTHNSYTIPDPLSLRSSVCNAIVELAKLADG